MMNIATVILYKFHFLLFSPIIYYFIFVYTIIFVFCSNVIYCYSFDAIFYIASKYCILPTHISSRYIYNCIYVYIVNLYIYFICSNVIYC